MITQRSPRKYAEPTRFAGVRFSVAEWITVEALMVKSGLNITDLIKTAIAEKARRNGLAFPAVSAEEAAS